MNFADFQHQRTALLSSRPDLLDAAETNLYQALSHLVPSLGDCHGKETIHRCHLASEWIQHFGLPPETAPRALISCGVRDSLRLIFGRGASHGRWWLPEDCYPVYHDLARAAGIVPRNFSTLPAPQWPVEGPITGDCETLLITNPLKPLGRWLSESDVETLKEWVTASPRRRILLDTVYSFAPSFHPSTAALVATSQAWVLHSLTKGWLHPRLFGVTLVPESDFAEWAPVFRAAAPPRENLAGARHLLARHPDCPGKVVSALVEGGRMLSRHLEETRVATLPVNAASYFYPTMEPWEALLNRGVLGLPVSVFGSPRKDVTFLSSLSFLPSITS